MLGTIEPLRFSLRFFEKWEPFCELCVFPCFGRSPYTKRCVSTLESFSCWVQMKLARKLLVLESLGVWPISLIYSCPYGSIIWMGLSGVGPMPQGVSGSTLLFGPRWWPIAVRATPPGPPLFLLSQKEMLSVKSRLRQNICDREQAQGNRQEATFNIGSISV